jgi:hypothetical protein
VALPIITVGLYPDVPAFRGVPQLRRSPTAAQIRALAIATAAISGRLWKSAASQTKWGIFNQANELIVEPDSILDFDNRNEFRVSDFPVQRGAFASYNKVATPFEAVVRLSRSGSLDSRVTFLRQIDDASRSLELYYILTPERRYNNVNIVRYEVTRRGSQGAYFLTDVDVYFREIREVAAQYSTNTAATANAQQPSAQPAVNDGIVYPANVPGTVPPEIF